jgi:hypothetical protein
MLIGYVRVSKSNGTQTLAPHDDRQWPHRVRHLHRFRRLCGARGYVEREVKINLLGKLQTRWTILSGCCAVPLPFQLTLERPLTGGFIINDQDFGIAHPHGTRLSPSSLVKTFLLDRLLAKAGLATKWISAFDRYAQQARVAAVLN